jgi:hypothetical protein
MRVRIGRPLNQARGCGGSRIRSASCPSMFAGELEIMRSLSTL